MNCHDRGSNVEQCWHETPFTFIIHNVEYISIIIVNVKIAHKLSEHDCEEDVSDHLYVVFVDAPETLSKMCTFKILLVSSKNPLIWFLNWFRKVFKLKHVWCFLIVVLLRHLLYNLCLVCSLDIKLLWRINNMHQVWLTLNELFSFILIYRCLILHFSFLNK